MTTPLARLLAEYFGTIALLARDEASADLARMAALAKRRVIAAGLALVALVWLNVALLLWIMQSEWRVLLAALVAVAAIVAAWLLARPGAAAKPMLSDTRAVLRDEVRAFGTAAEPLASVASGASADADAGPAVDDASRGAAASPGLPSPVDPSGPARRPAPRLEPAVARAHLHEIRVELGRALAPTERAGEAPGPGGPADAPPPVGFMPKSRTMQLLMAVWGGRPRGSAFGTVLRSLVGFVALRNRKLRRVATMIGLVRNATRLFGRRLRRA